MGGEEKEKQVTVSVTLEIVLTQEDIDDIMCGALEGGITYWCDEAKVVGDYLGEYGSEQIARGGKLRLHLPEPFDKDETEYYELDLEKFKKGVELWAITPVGCNCLEQMDGKIRFDTCNAGMESYIRSIATGRKTKEIAELVSAHFGIEFSEKQCKAYKKNHDIISGVDCRFEKGHVPANKGKPMSQEQYEKCKATMFKKGDVPANHMEVGEYTHTTDGYLIRKVKETGPQWERFEFVHRTVWEEHNGPVPEGKMVSFLDGNKDNCNIENLVLIDNEENLEMNRSRLRFADPERTKTGVLVAKARVTVRQKKRRK